MGLFGGGGDSGSNDAMNQEIANNEAELNTKKQNLYDTRLSIIKSQGQQTWTPDKNAGVSS